MFAQISHLQNEPLKLAKNTLESSSPRSIHPVFDNILVPRRYKRITLSYYRISPGSHTFHARKLIFHLTKMKYTHRTLALIVYSTRVLNKNTHTCIILSSLTNGTPFISHGIRVQHTKKFYDTRYRLSLFLALKPREFLCTPLLFPYPDCFLSYKLLSLRVDIS